MLIRCPELRNFDVSPGTKHKRGVKSRVKKLSVTRDQNYIFFLEVDPIPFLGLDLIDPRSSYEYLSTPSDLFIALYLWCHHYFIAYRPDIPF